METESSSNIQTSTSHDTTQTGPSFWGQVLKWLLIAIVIFLIIKIFTPLIAFKPWFDWWKETGGSSYNNCIDLVALAYWNYFPLYYYIRVLTTSEAQSFASPAYAYFISGLLLGGAQGIVNGGNTTPRSICQTLVPVTAPTDSSLNGKWPTTTTDWVALLTTWGNIQVQAGSPTPYTFSAANWENSPDNFLSNKWNIPADSNIVMGFVTNWANNPTNGQPLYINGLNPLLGINTGIESGGWWGFLQSGGDFGGMGLLELQTLVWGEQIPTAFTAQGMPHAGCSISSSIISGAGLGVAGIFLGGGVGLAVGIGGLVAGTLLDATSQGCFSGSSVSS